MIGLLLAILFVFGFYAAPMLVAWIVLALRERRLRRLRDLRVIRYMIQGLITRDVQ